MDEIEELKEQIRAAERVGNALAGAGTVEQRHARAIRELIYYRTKYGREDT
jgi:hypothetical protein